MKPAYITPDGKLTTKRSFRVVMMCAWSELSQDRRTRPTPPVSLPAMNENRVQ